MINIRSILLVKLFNMMSTVCFIKELNKPNDIFFYVEGPALQDTNNRYNYNACGHNVSIFIKQNFMKSRLSFILARCPSVCSLKGP